MSLTPTCGCSHFQASRKKCHIRYCVDNVWGFNYTKVATSVITNTEDAIKITSRGVTNNITMSLFQLGVPISHGSEPACTTTVN